MKQNTLTAFLLQLFGLSAVLYGALFLVFTKALPVQGMPLGLMFLILFGITSVSHAILVGAAKKGARSFTYSFMFISVVRLIIYGVFILLYALKHIEIAKAFALTFFGLYLLYTVFEIRSIFGYLKGK